MKCDSCEEKATVFYTQVIEGKLKKFVLCEACAQKKGITNVDDLLMGSDLLANSPPETKIQNIVAELNQEDCSACGFSLDDFRKVGRLGCPMVAGHSGGLRCTLDNGGRGKRPGRSMECIQASLVRLRRRDPTRYRSVMILYLPGNFPHQL